MNTLLLVDGSNFIMRAAFGGDVPPTQAAPIAAGLITRAARVAGATHMVVALDSPTPSWRREIFPDYKAHRTTDTGPWLHAAYAEYCRAGWYVESLSGYEADDIIATLAQRARDKSKVVIASSDSDLCCLAGTNVTILKPVNEGKFEFVNETDVCAKYQISAPAQLTELKALMGESGDNIPGVPGIGKMRAAKLLQTYENLHGILQAGSARKCKQSALVRDHEGILTLAYKLVSLRCDVPINPIYPKDCFVNI